MAKRELTAPRTASRNPAKGRQSAFDNYVSASLTPNRQTAEMFGGVGTD